LTSGQAEGFVDVDQNHVIVSTAGQYRKTAGNALLCECSSIFDNVASISPEIRRQGLTEGDGLGCHGVRQRTTEIGRTPLVDPFRVLPAAKHEAAARTSQGLMRGRRDDIGMCDGIEVTDKYLPCDKSREVSHVDP